MAVAKKDQERITYSWMYGQQARKDGKERVAPAFWREHADAWLQGFDGEAIGAAIRPVSVTMESEVDESAVED
ncbi:MULTISPECIES: hypothetical protein [unclassified Mesorhizobium]|uniref:hypothetical protein n=1 Tax=unclassified Mesorhizobium TaxID=325217 RepID=UPI00095CEAD0|nr:MULTISPECIES: hypothetical protein [unclassified Mesorhizobium]MBN9255301.1 hypothetical protein [Mesorhizobium sp.]OJX74224.1 MAG: hypothetical protein BGO93_16855 [Mesorhizobium sp. 65-26]